MQRRLLNKAIKPFIEHIAANVYDDAPRLILADWLEEHDHFEWAEFIRVQCELEPRRQRYELPGVAALHEREDQLLRKLAPQWVPMWFQGKNNWSYHCNECTLAGKHWELGVVLQYRRGFADTLTTLGSTFYTMGIHLREHLPTLRRVELFRLNGLGPLLADCSALAGLPELELGGWYPDLHANAFAASPHLSELQVLQLWLGRRQPMSDTRLCRTMAASAAWPKLRQLTLLNPNDEKVGQRRRMVDVCNEAAGRKVAVYQKGWPDVYPFAAEFWYLFPGYLPDGRMAMANLTHTTNPPSLCVLTFDAQGKQTKETLFVSLPKECIADVSEAWYKHFPAIRQTLVETLGFRPGFIRVQDCVFPGDSAYDRPSWSVYTFQGDDRLFGTTNESAYTDDSRGFAWHLARRMRDQEYVFGWDRYADYRGLVHST